MEFCENADASEHLMSLESACLLATPSGILSVCECRMLVGGSPQGNKMGQALH